MKKDDILNAVVDTALKNKDFTVELAIHIQTEQLLAWKGVLQEHAYNAVEKRAIRDNAIAKNGFDIFRGTDITNFIENYNNGL